MSLDWKMTPKDFPKQLIWRPVKNEPLNLEDTEQDCRVQPELECLIFSTMGIQHDLTGEMTDDKLKEICRRIDLLKGIGALPSYYASNDNPKRFQKIYPSIESVIRYWGLWTNVTHLSKSKWTTYLTKVSEVRDYSFESMKKDAETAIKEHPLLTEGERLLLQWKAEPPTDLTTPQSDC